jgi:glycosyltransferase involved in cell wall biosynthesis
MRLGVYSDMAYRCDDGGVSCGRAFVRFLEGLAARVDELVVFGRLDPEPGRAPYALSAPGLRFVPLPWYPRVTSLGGQVRALGPTLRVFSASLPRLDAVLVFGPHPVALALALAARAGSKPLVLGVRQNYPGYIRNRVPSRAWAWAPAAAAGLELGFRALARSAPTVAVGDELARRYAGGAPVLTTAFSLVRRDEVVPIEQPLAREWDGALRVLSVGRLDPEKNPLLLLDVMERLRSHDARWRLTVAGDGPLRLALAAAIRARGLADAVELAGEVPNGRPLWQLYGDSHVLLHVSLTEGLPQVLLEAMAVGVPIVATAVGGVPAALGHGQRGVLVPPADAGAAAAALERLAARPALREQLIRAGRAYALDQTLERQLDRLAAFVSAAAGLSASAPAAPASASNSQR